VSGEVTQVGDLSFDVGGVTMALSLIDGHIQAVTNELRVARCEQHLPRRPQVTVAIIMFARPDVRIVVDGGVLPMRTGKA
jgi:hypothetical protein